MKRILIAFVALTLASGCGGGGEYAQNTSGADTLDTNATDAMPDNMQAGAEPLVFCKPVEQRVRASDCEDLTALDESVYSGGALLNAPTPMKRGRPYEVTLIVDRRPQAEIAAIDAADNATAAATDVALENVADNAAAPEPAPKSEPKPGPTYASERPTPRQQAQALPGEKKEFAPPVGRFMQAELTGRGFKIEPEGPVSREVPRDGSATWAWTVTPKQGGQQRLVVTTVVEGVIEGKRYPLRNRTDTQDIDVRVDAIDRIKDGMTEATAFLKTLEGMLIALTAVAVAGFGLWYALRNKGKKGGTPAG